MKNLILSLAFLSAFTISSNVVNAEQAKPQITLLHAATTSSAGEALSYPTGAPKLVVAQVILAKGGKLPMHTHPAPLIVCTLFRAK